MHTPVKLTAAALAAAVGLSAVGAGVALASGDGKPAARPAKTASSHERSSRDRSRTLEKSIDRSKGSRAETSSARDR